MKVYLRIRHGGEFYNQNASDAFAGCSTLGIETRTYKAVYSVNDNEPGDPVVGALADVEVAMDRMGVKLTPLDYPEELLPFTGRKIWQSTLFTITSHPECWHVFVKPVWDVKRFSGTVLDKSEDLIKLGGGLEDVTVWCSEKIRFLSEWRLWVLDGEIKGLNPYSGQWDLFPDTAVLKKAVSAFHSAPRAYALDFGVTDDGRTLLVEASDGYALKSFGLDPETYVHILAARWQELTKDVPRRAPSEAVEKTGKER